MKEIKKNIPADIVAQNLKRLITEKEITQSEIAKIANVTNGSVSQWLAGEIIPRMGRLQKIANHFNLSISYFTQEKTDKIDLTNKTHQIKYEKDDFTYAMYNGKDEITKEQKDALIAMLNHFKEQNKNKII